MNEQEVRAIRNITPKDASLFLNGNPCPQRIRIWAQEKTCPFCWATKKASRHTYIISVEMLIKYRKGDLICVSV
mgnify:FL=1